MSECENCGIKADFELVSFVEDNDFDKLLCSICVISEALRKLVKPSK